jgi:hypothetical protein
MAVPAKNPSKREISRPTGLQEAAIRLLASGNEPIKVARALAPYMYPDFFRLDPYRAKKKARKTLRQWEDTEWFRDAVYQATMVRIDADIPQILRGMSRRARRRVDAARLLLEVTGRHNPRGQEAGPTVVQVNFGSAVPRPQTRPQLEEPIEDAEIVEEDG